MRKFRENAILWKCDCPNLYGNCVFPQNFRTRKLDAISTFYTMLIYLLPAYRNPSIANISSNRSVINACLWNVCLLIKWLPPLMRFHLWLEIKNQRLLFLIFIISPFSLLTYVSFRSGSWASTKFAGALKTK